MKITCTACHASYNLPDEKVAGRRVKVRCKRCSEPIVVDGSSLPSVPPPPDFEDEATRVMSSPSSEAPMWTVNLSESEQGDMTNEEIVAGWQAGVVTEDAYVWREGMDDWKPILDVPELVSLLSQEMPAEPEPPPPPEPVRLPAARAAADPREAIAPQIAAPRVPSPPKAAVSPPLGAGDLFASKPKPKREKPKQDASEARNENSMLFSLEALKAAARQPSSDAPPPASVRVDEDLLIMGGRQDVFNAPLIQIDAPTPPPQMARAASRAPMAVQGLPEDFAPRKQGGKGWMLGVAAVVILGAGGFFAYTTYIAPTSEAAPSAATAPLPPPEVTAVATALPEPPATASAAPAETDATAQQAAEVTKPPPGPPSGSDQGRDTTGSTDRGSDSTSEKSPSPGSGTPREDEGKEEPKEEGEEESPAADAPPFNTDAARSALSAAASNAAACKTSDGPTGSGKVQVTFVNSGRVTSANVVSGPFGGTSVGGCIARTFRQARVPAFSGDAQIVAKSFEIP